MKISTLTDVLAVAGLVLIAAGLWEVRPFLVLLYSGLVLLGAARALSLRERPRVVAAEEEK